MRHLGKIQARSAGIKDDFGMAYLISADACDSTVVFLERDYVNDMYKVTIFLCDVYYPIRNQVFGTLQESLDYIIKES